MKGLALLLIAGLSIWAAFQCDDAVDRWVLAHRTPAAIRAARVISQYGDWPYMMAASLVVAYGLHRRNHRRWVRIVCAMMISSTLAGIAVNTVRLTAGRTRPNANVAPGWYGPRHDGRWLVGANQFNAFPSGHTATAVGYAVPLLLLAPEIGAPVLLMALIIAGSRVYLRAHHLSDITTAGIVAAWIAVRITQRGMQSGSRVSQGLRRRRRKLRPGCCVSGPMARQKTVYFPGRSG